VTAYLAWQCGQPKVSLDGDVLERGVRQFVRRWRMRCRTALLWVVILPLRILAKSRDSDGEPRQYSPGIHDNTHPPDKY
jgi:hypothetical protein